MICQYVKQHSLTINARMFDTLQRKVLGVLVKAPQTTVEITPPAKGTDLKLTPEEQLLRALYSYDKPEDYVDQASWLKLQKSNKVSSLCA